MSLATHSLLAQQQEAPQEDNKPAIIPGTFGGEGVLGHEARQTDGFAYQENNTQGTQGIAPDVDGMLSFQPKAFAAADDNQQAEEPKFTLTDTR